MTFQITVRHGGRRQRYHTFTVDADDIGAALLGAAAEIPPDIAADGDLVEIRVAVDPDARRFVGEE